MVDAKALVYVQSVLRLVNIWRTVDKERCRNNKRDNKRTIHLIEGWGASKKQMLSDYLALVAPSLPFPLVTLSRPLPPLTSSVHSSSLPHPSGYYILLFF